MPTAKSKAQEAKPARRKPALRLVSGESKYQAIFDQASDAIVMVTSDGVIDAANRAAEELTGYLKSEIENERLAILEPDSKVHHIPERSRMLCRDILSSPGTYEDVAVARKDGYIRLVDVTVRFVSSAGNQFQMLLFRDVTEKKKMERELITKHAELRNAYVQLEKKNAELQSMQEMLVQAGKMAALGELSAGIAHELNQPLQGIRGYAQEAHSRVESSAEAGQVNPELSSGVIGDLKEIISSADKMSKIIRYLRDFTRKSVEEHEFTNVHHAIDEALKMLSRQFASRGIEVQRNFQEGLPEVYANPLQLEQVFINLATNARDAIEEKGAGAGSVRITTRKRGKFVEIVVDDDGIGMSERTKQKIFNPFYTTKEVGKGMGIGLSLSYGMISKLHGSILVESEFGKGTAFVIRIPIDFRELG